MKNQNNVEKFAKLLAIIVIVADVAAYAYQKYEAYKSGVDPSLGRSFRGDNINDVDNISYGNDYSDSGNG